MPKRAVYIGWDVGGWEGEADGVAALRWADEGFLRPAGRPVCLGLKSLLCSSRFSVDALLDCCGAAGPWERAVIGIDANLGWPLEFLELVSGSPTPGAQYLPAAGEREIDNALAFRSCDRVIHRLCGKKPLSATFDRLGNNCTKAMVGCRLLAASDGAAIAVMAGAPGRATVVEAYPALWKTGARKASPLLPEAASALAGCHLPAPGSDEADALLCALTAACYDNQARSLGRPLPALLFPEDPAVRDGDEGEIRRRAEAEGWAFWPAAAAKRDDGNE